MAEVKNDNTIEIVEQKEAKAENEPAIEGMGFDEYLARTVQKYPVIYDKSCKDFHDRDVKDNAWQTVAREVGLLSGTSFCAISSQADLANLGKKTGKR